MQIRTAVLGARGRMGSASVREFSSLDDIEVAAEIDMGEPLDALTDKSVSVALDFTQPQAAVENVCWCIDHGVSIVVGTSGFTQDRLDEVRSWLGPAPSISVLVVPNFSIGAIILMQLAARAAPWFESVEVVEMHHPDKVDAPSGTATRTAEMIAGARQDADCPAMPDATTSDPLGARGARISGIPVHAVRARGFTASQEVQFGNTGELFALRHDSVDRASFMPGIVAAVRAVGAGDAPRGLTVGLENLLDL